MAFSHRMQGPRLSLGGLWSVWVWTCEWPKLVPVSSFTSLSKGWCPWVPRGVQFKTTDPPALRPKSLPGKAYKMQGQALHTHTCPLVPWVEAWLPELPTTTTLQALPSVLQQCGGLPEQGSPSGGPPVPLLSSSCFPSFRNLGSGGTSALSPRLVSEPSASGPLDI